MEPKLPIGIFDSGIGGITVLKVLRQHFPQENFLYVGDTARLPYGTKSPQTIRIYAEQIMNYLVDTGVWFEETWSHRGDVPYPLHKENSLEENVAGGPSEP
jgi:hypothetical protein